MNVLLVEPDRVLGNTYAQTLAHAGHQVAAAASAQGAIQVADELKPDVVILEIQLVEHSGIEFLYEFRSYREWQHVPVIVLTHVPPAEFNHNRQLLMHELGIETYLYKPSTSLRQLLELVDQTVLTAA